MAATQTIVMTSLDTHLAIPVPDDLRAAIEHGPVPADRSFPEITV